MSKIWILLLGFAAYQIYSLQNPQKGSEDANPTLIYGRWATFDDKIWYEFYHNGVCNGKFDGEEFVGSYRQTDQGEFEITKARKGKREKVFMRGGRLVCLNRHVEFRLRKIKDFVPGVVQSEG